MHIPKKYILAVLAVLFTISCAGTLQAADPTKTQVNGKELDSIADIMREVNGGSSTLPNILRLSYG